MLFKLFKTLKIMANVNGILDEFMQVKGKEFIGSIYDEPQVSKLVTNYPQVNGTLNLPTADIEKDLLHGYDGNDDAEEGVITLSEVPMSTSMIKLVLEVDLGSETMRGYDNYLRTSGKSADEVSVVQYFIDDAEIKPKMGAEIDIAAFQGKALFAPSASKPLRQTVAGYRTMVKAGAALGKAKVINTGAINKTNAVDKFETLFAGTTSALQSIGTIFCVPFGLYNAYLSNYHSAFNNSATEQMIMGTTYTGTKFHLGAGKSFIIPFAGMGDDDAVMMTTLKNLAYLYDIDEAAKTLDIQKIGFKHKILARLPIGFGIRKMSDKLVIVNDRLIANS
jgi:hypothetical protein